MNVFEFAELLNSPQRKRVILDTDTFNEVDDQFALAYAMLSPERVELLSVNAAPYVAKTASTAAEGSEKSYGEILHIMELTRPGAGIPAFRGSAHFLSAPDRAEESEACDNIVRTVNGTDGPVVIIAVGALTNVASALIRDPGLAGRTAVIWLGGHSLDWPHTREFNLWGDPVAARAVFDSGVPLMHIPCQGVCSAFTTTVPELRHYLGGRNALCDYLTGIVEAHAGNPYGWSKVIWDVTAVAAVTKPDALRTSVIPRPVITSEGLWAFDTARAPYLYVSYIRRDPIYADLFRKLSGAAGAGK